MDVYGCIVLPNGAEMFWSGDSTLDVYKELQTLPGTQYGTHWTFPRDTGLEDSNICVSNPNTTTLEGSYSFEGKGAIKDFLDFLVNLHGVMGAPGVQGE